MLEKGKMMLYQLYGWSVPFGTKRATHHKIAYDTRDAAKRAFHGICRGSCSYAQLAYMVDDKNGFLLADYTPRRGVTWFGGGNNGD